MQKNEFNEVTCISLYNQGSIHQKRLPLMALVGIHGYRSMDNGGSRKYN